MIAPFMAMVCFATFIAEASAATPREIVLQAEARRTKLIERLAPAVVCVFNANLRGGGSGVLIDEDGYGLTNYHVVRGLMKKRKGWGGLGDGILYELEVLGVDVTGDVAMFRLVPPKEGYKFPHAKLGDSDGVRVGDTAIAMGNPFILSEDYTPTVTLGIITGVHRYQWGVKGNLVYSDCIQIDASINPGSSGGPLFNAAGEIIGINGRISVNTRGRFNVGFGYAICSNQIKRFMPAMRAGLLARHGTWQAQAEMTDDGDVVFASVRDPGPAFDAGVRQGDKLLAIDGTAITTANQVASVLGTYPERWPVVLDIERGGDARRIVLRLDPLEPKLRAAYKVPLAFNLRQAGRTLDNFRRAALGDSVNQVPAHWTWTVRRTHHPAPDGRQKPAERFAAHQEGNGPIRLSQQYEDGAPGRVIEFTQQTADQRTTLDGESFALPADLSMVLGAIHTVHRWLRTPADQRDMTDVSHAGGEAIRQTFAVDAPRLAPPRLVEVIESLVGDQATARFAFDSKSFALVRVTVRDELAGREATITLSDHRDIGGIVWPCTWEVEGEGYAYRDTLLDWELKP